MIDKFCIAVLDRGFVFVGLLTETKEWYTMKNSKNIRRWGTINGLGELAKKGPLEKTILDDYGHLKIPKISKSLIFTIITEKDLWEK